MESPPNGNNGNNGTRKVEGAVLSSLFPDTQFLSDVILKYRDFFERAGWTPRWTGSRPSSGALFVLLAKIDNFIVDQPHLDPLYLFDRYGLTIEDQNTLSNTIWPEIVKTLEDAGYEFHYFAFFKSDDPAVRVFWDRIKPTPETFEGGTTLFTPNIYENILNTIKKSELRIGGYEHNLGGGTGYNLSGIDTSNGIQITGWRKKDLFDAIMAAGLHVPVVTVEGATVQRSPLSDLMKYYRKKMPGFGATPYMPRMYYEAIYRKIFNTLINIDWAQACSKRLVSFQNIRNFVVRDFGFDYRQILKLNYKGLCNLLVQESERRRTVREELKEGIPMAQPIIAMQPGALAVQLQAQTLGQFAPTMGPQPFPVNPIYQELYEICATDSGETKAEILQMIITMGLSDIIAHLPRTTTKEEYCRVLKNYIETTQKRDIRTG